MSAEGRLTSGDRRVSEVPADMLILRHALLERCAEAPTVWYDPVFSGNVRNSVGAAYHDWLPPQAIGAWTGVANRDFRSAWHSKGISPSDKSLLTKILSR